MSTGEKHRGLVVVAIVGLIALLGACASSGDGGPAEGESASGAESTTTTVDPMNADPVQPGAERLHFEYGPVTVKPGQNAIDFSDGKVPKPDEAGWIVRISPNIKRLDGTVPPVDVIHLHHGVWLNGSRSDPTSPQLPERFFAAGEEKSIATMPEGYGYRYEPDDRWTINYMIHNLYPATEEIMITYDLDFIAADAAEADDIVEVRPIWMDVQNGSVYPVFDAIKGTGDDGTYTYPDDNPLPYPGNAALNEWTVDRDGVIVGTAGHLHPGGLYNDLSVTRNGEEAPVFRSTAEYWEPNGPVSWDLAMTATPPDWRVQVRAGDVLTTSVTYETELASWYESMGIMVLWMADGEGGADPFTEDVAVEGAITHGRLPENQNKGGEDLGVSDPRDMPSGSAAGSLKIADWVYEQGDFSESDTEIPVVPPGGTITFDNIDAPLENGIWHTLTACAPPCNKSTGVAYPLADGAIPFDSGELGEDGPPTAGRVTWQTPPNLPEGTYTYFCRIHPFMRGGFRVDG